MNVVVCVKLQSVSEAIAKKLIPEGINIIKTQSLLELDEMVPEISKMAIIEEGLFELRDIIKTIKEIKDKSGGEKSYITILSKDVLDENEQFLIKIGVDFVLHRGLDRNTIALKIFKFINHFCKDENKRRYARISLKNNKNTDIKIMSNNNYISGKVTDISMNGVVVLFDKTQPISLINNHIYTRTKIKIEDQYIFADLKLVKHSNELAAFKFQNLEKTFKEKLASYIYYKMQKILSK